MPRPLAAEGYARLLTFSCLDRRALLAEEEHRDIIVDHIALSRDRLGFHLFAFVVMPNHVHLFLWPNEGVASISRILSAIKTRTARRLLPILRLRDKGLDNLWLPGGGHDRFIYSRHEIEEKIKYIHDNPVRKGLAELPEAYRWSSAHRHDLVDDWH